MIHKWIVVGPKCGRDKNGTFRCVCGRCRELPRRTFKQEVKQKAYVTGNFCDCGDMRHRLVQRMDRKNGSMYAPCRKKLYASNGSRDGGVYQGNSSQDFQS